MADVDVMESGGEEADRRLWASAEGVPGLPPQGAECAAARSHEIGEIGDVIKKILSRPEGFRERRLIIAERARRAVLYEAAARQAGAGGPCSRGAHTDMDFYLSGRGRRPGACMGAVCRLAPDSAGIAPRTCSPA